jgi:hypothetical protein
VEFLIDPAGRSRRIGNRDVATAVSKVGYVHLLVIERSDNTESRVDRTAIAALQPGRVSEATVAALGNKLAAVHPDRTVVVAYFPTPECWVFSDCLAALRKVTALADDRSDGGSTSGFVRPI